MEITVIRHALRDTYTIGRLEINGKKFCDTLEDTDRGLRQDMPIEEIRQKKVYGKTAIPTGTYRVSIQYWSKHKIYIPYLHDVPGFTSILIHNGRTAADSLGCILVGLNKVKGQVLNGRYYMHELTRRIRKALLQGEKIRITIKYQEKSK